MMKAMMKSVTATRMSRFAMAAVLLAVSFVRSPLAHADQILLASTNLVFGSSAATYSFDAPSDGTVTARLTSIDWPVPLSALSFSATTATQTLDSWSSTNSSPHALDASATDSSAPFVDSFKVGAGTYFAHVMATAGGSLDLGLYSLMLTFTPSAVPLPTAVSMLLLGLLVLFGLKRTLPEVSGRLGSAGRI